MKLLSDERMSPILIGFIYFVDALYAFIDAIVCFYSQGAMLVPKKVQIYAFQKNETKNQFSQYNWVSSTYSFISSD